MRRGGLLLIPLFAGLPLAGQNFPEIKVEKVAGKYRYTEGPAWSREGFLLFADSANNKIWKLSADSPPEVLREDSKGTYGLAIDSHGRLYACEAAAGRVTRTDKNGKVEVLAERFEGKRLNGPNDIVVRHDGHAWFTDPAFGSEANHRELDFYGIYHLSPKGELSLVAKTQGRPNGIALSPNGRTLYVSDSDQRLIRAWDLERGGEAAGERVLIAKVDGIPDGIKTDAKGNLYVCARAIEVFTPAGKRLASIPLPEKPSNCVFGDGDRQTLYITARTSVYRIRLDVKGSGEE